MSEQEFEQMLELNQPHELFNLEWFSYYAEDFDKTFFTEALLDFLRLSFQDDFAGARVFFHFSIEWFLLS